MGCLAAHLLASQGYVVQLVEKRPDFLHYGIVSRGRTINLSLSPRGLKALDAFGCREELLRISVPMDRRVIHPARGREAVMHYADPTWRNYSVSRNALNMMLLQKALRNTSVQARFETTCSEIHFEERRATLIDKAGGLTEHPYDILIGADGAFSAVRECLAARGRVSTDRTELASGYKELSLKPARNEVCETAIHVWPRRGFFLVALPNVDRTFKCTLVLKREGFESFANIQSEEQLRQFTREHFADIADGLSELEDAFGNPVGRITTVSSAPMHWGDSVLLIGDAAHTVAPFLGQGINLGFEDCLVLSQLLRQHTHRTAVLQQYSQERVPNADAAATLSLANYTELTQKNVHRRHTRHVAPPAPILVNFLGLTYSEALARSGKSHRKGALK